MGQLFENFEKVDIKVERKNTEEARNRAEAAEKKAEAAEKKAEEERQKAMQSYVFLCRELGGSKETAVCKLMEVFGLTKAEAEKQANNLI